MFSLKNSRNVVLKGLTTQATYVLTSVQVSTFHKKNYQISTKLLHKDLSLNVSDFS